MRLARKLVAVLVLGLLLFTIGFDLRDIRNDQRTDEQQLERDLRQAAVGFGASLDVVEQTVGGDAAARVIALRNARGGSQVRRLSAAALEGLLPPNERALLAQQGTLRVILDGGHPQARMAVYQSLLAGGYLEMSQSLDGVHAQIRAAVIDLLWKSLLLFLMAALCAFVLGALFVARPIQTLIGFARRIGQGDLNQRVILSGRDELGELASTLNTMCERLTLARTQLAAQTAEKIAAIEQLRHADRLKTVGQLSAGIAHELGTPLNVVSGHAKMILSGESTVQEVAESADVIIAQTEHIAAIIRQLLDFARPNKPSFAEVDLVSVSRHTVKMLAHLAAEKKVQLVLEEASQPVIARADDGQIGQALLNLIVNALQAVKPKCSVFVRVHHATVVPPNGQEALDWACIDVRDEGPGISSDDLPRIFDPFFTTKAAGEGSGLGLSVSRGIVEEHGGFIDVKSTVLQGSCFSIFLPRAEKRLAS